MAGPLTVNVGLIPLLGLIVEEFQIAFNRVFAKRAVACWLPRSQLAVGSSRESRLKHTFKFVVGGHGEMIVAVSLVAVAWIRKMWQRMSGSE
jgi:hypothetical protein